MPATKKFSNKALDLKPFPGRADVEVSKILTTPKGDKIRAIVTTGNRVILTSLAKSDGNTIIWTGEGQDMVMYSKVWDAIVRGAGAIWDLLTKGQNCTPVKIIVLETHKDGTVKMTTTETMDCKPA